MGARHRASCGQEQAISWPSLAGARRGREVPPVPQALQRTSCWQDGALQQAARNRQELDLGTVTQQDPAGLHELRPAVPNGSAVVTGCSERGWCCTVVWQNELFFLSVNLIMLGGTLAAIFWKKTSV